MALIEVREVRGIKIYLDQSDGRFTAKVGGRQMTRKELGPIVSHIKKLTGVSITCYVIAEGHRYPAPTGLDKKEVVGKRRDRWVFADGTESGKWTRIYKTDPEKEPELLACIEEGKRLVEEGNALRVRFDRIKHSLREVKESDFTVAEKEGQSAGE